ncbi:hypothetical protein, partial [Pseudanabaena sp. lw0831]|uniref:hypothetical protein n=1 Tax=Pseudanabaena sp. lw0831 TaxID=1357935 RepID=UPI001F2D885C
MDRKFLDLYLSGAENLGESHTETVVTRENSIRKSNIFRLVIEAQAGGGLLWEHLSLALSNYTHK